MAANTKFLTFDVNNCDSIDDFNNKVYDMIHSGQHLGDDFLLKYFKKAINYLHNCKKSEYLNQNVTQLIGVCANILFDVNTEDLMNKIVKFDFYPIFKKLLEYYMKEKIAPEKSHLKSGFLNGLFSLKSQFKKPDESDDEDENSDINWPIMEIFLALSSASKHGFDIISTNNIQYGFIKLALDCLKNRAIFDSNSNTFLSTYDSIIVFLCNNSQHDALKEDLRNLNVNEVIQSEIVNVDNEFYKYKTQTFKDISEVFKMRLTSIIVFVIEDKELDKMEFTKEIVSIYIRFLQKIIDMSIDQKKILGTKFYMIYQLPSSNLNCYIYATGILKYLYKVSINDNAKQVIHDLNVIPMLIKLIVDGNSEEQELSYELICSLCFNDNARKSIENNKDLLKLIKEAIVSSKNKDVVKLCKQIIEMIDQTLQKRIQMLPSDVTKQQESLTSHIMISYNHSSKTQCIKLNTILKSKGYKTWFDVDNMLNDIHDDMAKAVENSSIVLICYSEKYKNSNNCRLEAQYATNLCKKIIPVRMQDKYKPDGWLGIILGGSKYITLSDSNFDETHYLIKELIRCIDAMLNRKVDNLTSDINEIKIENSKTKDQSIIKWNQNNIDEWLKSNDLNEFIPFFKGYDGASFLGLCEMKNKDYNKFCTTIEDELKAMNLIIPLRIRAKFYKLIDSLLYN